jgi:hypothetical protein
VGGSLGGLFLAAVAAVAYDDENARARFAVLVIGAPVAGGFGGYYAGRPLDRKTTLIKVMPD